MKNLMHIQSIVDPRNAICGKITNKVISDWKDKKLVTCKECKKMRGLK